MIDYTHLGELVREVMEWAERFTKMRLYPFIIPDEYIEIEYRIIRTPNLKTVKLQAVGYCEARGPPGGVSSLKYSGVAELVDAKSSEASAGIHVNELLEQKSRAGSSPASATKK
jgi:hypothetical protein